MADEVDPTEAAQPAETAGANSLRAGAAAQLHGAGPGQGLSPGRLPRRHPALRWLAGLVLALVAATSWASGLSQPGIDFYQFWVTGQAALGRSVDNVYAPETRRQLGERWLAASARSRAQRRQREAARQRPVFETFSTPLLYAAFGTLASGDYERDFRRFQLGSTLLGLVALLAMARVAGLGLAESALLVALVAAFEPWTSELHVGNVNRLQLAGLAVFLALRSPGHAGGRDAAAGAVLGALVAFKPNLGLALALLWLARAAEGQWRRLGLEASGAAAALGVALGGSSLAFGSARPWLQWAQALGELFTHFQAATVAAGNFALVQILQESLHARVGALATAVVGGGAAAAVWIARSRPAASTLDEGPSSSRRGDLLVLGLGCVAGLAASGLTWLHYYLLALPLVIALLGPSSRPVLRAGAVLALSAISLVPFRLAGSPSALAAAWSAAGGNLLLLAAGVFALLSAGGRDSRAQPPSALGHAAAALCLCAAAAPALLHCSRPAQECARIVLRLAEPEARTGSRAAPAFLLTTRAYPAQPAGGAPWATVGSDTRPVLFAHPRKNIAFRRSVRVDAEGRADVELPLGHALAGARQVLCSIVAQADGHSWTALPPALVPVSGGDQGRRIALRIDVGRGPARPVLMGVIAQRPLRQKALYQSPALRIPEGARLEFALGIEDAAAGQGPVRFWTQACQQDDSCETIFDRVVDPADPSGRSWQNQRVALDRFAGERRSLRFWTESVRPHAASLPLWADPTVTATELRPKGPARRPSFVLISIDTLRRDHLELYGYARSTAPFLSQELARQGVVFDDLVAEATTTDPSHMTMFTSLPSLVHGVECCLRPLAVPVTTLAERLRAAGYRTAAFTEDGPLAHDRGFSKGFGSYFENKSPDSLNPTGQVEQTFEQGRGWLAAHREVPFFLFLHTFQVHFPYEPPPAYARFFQGPAPAGTVPRAAEAATLYDREIRYVDDELRKLFAWAKQRGLLEDTYWILLSDHGEEFLEHGSMGHGTLPFEPVSRIPLVVLGPGVARGERRHAAVHHLDLLPTVLELAGLPPLEGAMGHSFAALLGPGADEAPWQGRPRLTTSWVLPPSLQPPGLALRRSGRKLLRVRTKQGIRAAFFDLRQDPAEQHDRQRSEPQQAQALAKLLEDQVQQALARRKELEARRGTKAIPQPADPQRLEKLRALGYVE